MTTPPVEPTVNPARTMVATVIKTGKPTWNVLSEVRPPDAVDKPTVLIWTNEITPRPTAGSQTVLIASDVVMWVFPTQDAKGFEDRADLCMTQAVEALSASEGITWTKAERMSLGSLAGWKVTVAVSHSITFTPTL